MARSNNIARASPCDRTVPRYNDAMPLPLSVVERSKLHHGKSEQQLRSEGWQRCFIAEEPRLSESVETYEDLGLEAITMPVRATDGECTSCMTAEPGRFHVIYTRPAR